MTGSSESFYFSKHKSSHKNFECIAYGYHLSMVITVVTISRQHCDVKAFINSIHGSNSGIH